MAVCSNSDTDDILLLGHFDPAIVVRLSKASCLFSVAKFLVRRISRKYWSRVPPVTVVDWSKLVRASSSKSAMLALFQRQVIMKGLIMLRFTILTNTEQDPFHYF